MYFTNVRLRRPNSNSWKKKYLTIGLKGLISHVKKNAGDSSLNVVYIQYC